MNLENFERKCRICGRKIKKEEIEKKSILCKDCQEKANVGV